MKETDQISMRKKNNLKGDLLLLLITTFWGASYYLSDVALGGLGPFTVNAWRFLIAFALAWLVFVRRMKKPSAATLKYALLVGLILSFVYTMANYSLLYTSLSNAGFLCCLAVVFTPIFAFVFQKKKPGRKLFVVILMALAGTALLTLTESFVPRLGDIFGILCAVGYTVDLLVTERAVAEEDVDVLQLGIFQLGVVGVVMFVLSAAFERPADGGGLLGLIASPQGAVVWGSVLVLAVFCSGAAFIIQTYAQQFTEASRAGVIFTAEPVIAGFIAFFVAGEVLLPRAYFGALLLVSGILVMEIERKEHVA
jgi:drug/metabolite transporter (DMT)-like permease